MLTCHRGVVNEDAMRYINRLSDHLFVLARRLNENGKTDGQAARKIQAELDRLENTRP